MKVKSTSTRLMTGVIVVMLLGTFSACNSKAKEPEKRTAEVQPSAADPSDLRAAMKKLEGSIDKPTEPFHLSLKKSGSDGFTYLYEADVSTNGITGKITHISPETKVGTDVFPASTTVKDLKGTPMGSPDWTYAKGNIEGPFLHEDIGDAQEGVKYVGDESVGGFDARRYDFDLAGVDATIKQAMKLGNSVGGMRQTKDFNMKGSAWIAKNDGRLVKFQYDTIYVFSDGTNTTHLEGAVTKQ